MMLVREKGKKRIESKKKLGEGKSKRKRKGKEGIEGK